MDKDGFKKEEGRRGRGKVGGGGVEEQAWWQI